MALIVNHHGKRLSVAEHTGSSNSTDEWWLAILPCIRIVCGTLSQRISWRTGGPSCDSGAAWPLAAVDNPENTPRFR